MLRVAIPYGLLNTKQVRMLAHIARKYDKGFAHFTTRQNVQYNWPELEQVPNILADLASVQMHAIQTSGNCIRNTTSDEYAGVAPDELEDPRPYCEIIRQWSTFHPEFTYLPRKFKIAVTGAEKDRAAIQVHDIGLRLRKNSEGETGFEVYVGGGLGRTPVVGDVVREFLPKKDLLTYLEAILRVYNLLGRRDNKYKARIKIMLKALGRDKLAAMIENEWEHIKSSSLELTEEEIARVQDFFAPPSYETLDDLSELGDDNNQDFQRWVKQNVKPHKISGYAAVVVTLKSPDVAPGDITDSQLEKVADLADEFSFGMVRATHKQNLILADVKQKDLYTLWQALNDINCATANAGCITDMICCPGLTYCSLANAHSIPIAEEINQRFDDLDYVHDLGELRLNISGCMNACGHHHVAAIGILGVDKKGKEFYQVTIGGSSGDEASIGKILGPSFAREEIADAIENLVKTYVELRQDDEPFLETVRRIGTNPFKERLYA
jgi:sulfite reductase (NADPH) hemoprotein beta-component